LRNFLELVMVHQQQQQLLVLLHDVPSFVVAEEHCHHLVAIQA
jgi:hypothetical protein